MPSNVSRVVPANVAMPPAVRHTPVAASAPSCSGSPVMSILLSGGGSTAAAADGVRGAALATLGAPAVLERLTGQWLSPKRASLAALTNVAPGALAAGPTGVRSAPNA